MYLYQFFLFLSFICVHVEFFSVVYFFLSLFFFFFLVFFFLCADPIHSSYVSQNPSYVSDALEDYKDRYPAFERSRECKVISNLADAYVAGDVEKFEDTLSEYDNVSIFLLGLVSF